MKEKTYTFKTMVPVIGMLLSFLGVCFFTSLYMAKDNNYDNIIYQYFHISKQLHFRMIPSLTLYEANNSHNPSIYQGYGCFHFCIDMYYF